MAQEELGDFRQPATPLGKAFLKAIPVANARLPPLGRTLGFAVCPDRQRNEEAGKLLVLDARNSAVMVT